MLGTHEPLMSQRIMRGLQHYWPLDEVSGNAKDAIWAPDAGPIDLTDTNTVTGGVGPSANLPLARSFDPATDEKFTVADARSLLMGVARRGFTAQIWANPTSVAAVIGLFGNDQGGTNRSWRVLLTTTPNWQFFIYDGSSILGGVTSGTPVAGAWHHVMFTANHVNSVLWVNGIRLGASPHTGGFAWSQTATGNFDLGNDNVAATREWNGLLCAAALWHRQLTDNEIRWLYNNGQGQDLRRYR